MAKILVIENDAERRHILKAVLLANGHEVVDSADPEIAWTKMIALEECPELIIIFVPQAEVVPFLLKKHKERGYTRIPVIFLFKPEKFNKSEMEKGPKHDYWFYETIPFNPGKLVVKVGEVLAKTTC